MRDDRHVVAGDILKDLCRTLVAQHQNGRELEMRIDLAADALDFAPLLQACEKAAKALVQILPLKPAYKQIRSSAAPRIPTPAHSRSSPPARLPSHSRHRHDAARRCPDRYRG